MALWASRAAPLVSNSPAAMPIVDSFQVPLWVLSAMQYANDLNPLRRNSIKHCVILDDQAPDIRQEF